MNPIIPVPPPAPRVVELPSLTVPPASFSPTAVTARPNRPSIEPRQEPPPQRKPPHRRAAHRAIGVAVLVVGAVAASFTESGPQHPTIVSGRAAPKVSDSGDAVRWWKDSVTITTDASLADIGADAEDAVRSGFGTWAAHDDNLPKLRFDSSSKRKPVTLTPDGENRVYFAPITVPGHENDLAITLAYTRPDTGEVTEADVVLNSKHPYGVLLAAGAEEKHGKGHGNSAAALSFLMASGCSGTYDVQSVVTHEIGHFFGLGEDTTDAAATMYFSTLPCDLGKRDLSTADASEMSTLYAGGALSVGTESGDAGSPVAASCAVRSSTPAPSQSGLGLALALGLGAWIRRRR